VITVMVCAEDNGRPIKNVRVALEGDGLVRDLVGDEWTDGSGEAQFDCKAGQGKVYVDGQAVYLGQLAGRVVVYV
jgi:hypothetical protein